MSGALAMPTVQHTASQSAAVLPCKSAAPLCSAKSAAVYDCVWMWRKWPVDARWQPTHRKGQRCRIVSHGGLNSALVEFCDGSRVLTSRYAARRVAS